MDQQSSIPSPESSVEPKLRLKMKEFFLWAGAIIALYSSISAFIAIVFAILNKALPDALDMGSFFFSGSGIGALSLPIATLIVMFPLGIVLVVVINRMLEKEPERAALRFRKFVLWFTLFLTAGMIATDLITTIVYFLDGEITLRFIYKVLVILMVGGLVGSYFLYNLRRPVVQKSNIHMYYALIAGVLALGALITVFAVFGGPKSQRALTLDSERISTLQSLESGIASYYSDKDALPTQITDIQTYGSIKDPEFKQGKTIEYIPVSDTSYQLCATFSTVSSNETDQNAYYSMQDQFAPKGDTDPWKHGKGRTCFDRTIDPTLPNMPTMYHSNEN